jgi:hypothetical protein
VWESGDKAPSIFNSEIDRGEWSVSCFGLLYSLNPLNTKNATIRNEI